MSTNATQTAQNSAAATALIASGFFAFISIFSFGWIGDLAKNVHPDGDRAESLSQKFGQWFSVLIHAGGASTVALFNPIWALIWGTFAIGVFARRIAAQSGIPAGFRDYLGLNDPNKGIRYAFAGLGSLAVLAAALHSTALSTFVVPSAIFLAGIQGSRVVKQYRDLWHRSQQWHSILGATAGVSPNYFGVPEFGAVLQVHSDGHGVIVSPLPPEVAPRFNQAEWDSRLATINPSLEVSPDSTSQRVEIRLASAETRARREAFASSGGLHEGIEAYVTPAAIAVPSVSTPEASNMPHTTTDVSAHFNLPSTAANEPPLIQFEDL